MNATIKVQLDCTERLERVLSDVVQALSEMRQEPTPLKKKPQEPRSPGLEPLPPKQEPLSPKQEQQEVKQQVPSQEEQKQYTDADLRTAMRNCRERLLGKYADDPIMKKSVNDTLRGKVAAMGFKASTDIPQDKRKEFVDYCASITINFDKDATDPPF